MTHQTLLVVLPEHITDIADPDRIVAEVAALMEPYCEHRNLTPSYETCHCVTEGGKPDPNCGRYTEEDVEWYRDYHRRKGEPLPYVGLRYYGTANEMASACGGTGTVLVMQNENRQWDWYEVGGRWDGVITGRQQERLDDLTRYRRYADDDGFYERLRRESSTDRVRWNACKMSEVQKLDRIYATLTPDDGWAEKGYNRPDLIHHKAEEGQVWGWDESPSWEAEKQSLVEHYPARIAVLIDYHI